MLRRLRLRSATLDSCGKGSTKRAAHGDDDPDDRGHGDEKLLERHPDFHMTAYSTSRTSESANPPPGTPAVTVLSGAGSAPGMCAR